jgi:hypothetical protein
MIRKAEIKDVPRLVELGEMFYNMTPYSEIVPYNPVSTKFLFEAMLTHPENIIFVAVRGLQIIGAIGATIGPCTYNFDHKTVLESFWFFAPDQKDGRAALSLISAIEVWAKTQGASCLIMGLFSGMNEKPLNALYERKGFIASEKLYLKGV